MVFVYLQCQESTEFPSVHNCIRTNNSMWGATFLSDVHVSGSIVIDIGGTTADVGV